MRLKMGITRLEWLSFLLVMPFIDIYLNYVLFGRGGLSLTSTWLISFPLIFFIGFIAWFLQIWVMYILRKYFNNIIHTGLRLSALAFSHITIATVAYTAIFYFYNRLHLLNYSSSNNHIIFSVLLAIIQTMIVTTLWEADYTFKQWKQSVSEKERLEQHNLHHEFEKLKRQVNPHFLFNCFNTLSSLISEDKKQAEEFLNELSKVYRYLLRINEDGLSRLHEEIKFAQSYFQLLKTRYGEAIQLSLEIDKKYEQYLIPTLSLQLLIENAVKHNTLTRIQPLIIDIFTTSGNKIVINNNLQAKTTTVLSNKVGLENIKNKYELLGHHDFEVLKDNKSYTVVLPLIWNKTADQKLVSLEP